MKDSAAVRNPSRDSLHAALEYVDGPLAVDPDQTEE